MNASPTGSTLVAGVVGAPVKHSLSPTIHNAWIAAAELDAVYVAFGPQPDRFAAFVEGMRGGVARGVNVTAPFKEVALAIADRATRRALASGAANLLIFDNGGLILADNTDGVGLLAALSQQAPEFDPTRGPIVILGAGGAARGAAATLLEAGAPQIRVINRSIERGGSLIDQLGDRSRLYPERLAGEALAGACLVINATPVGLNGFGSVNIPLELAGSGTIVMDMNYKPLQTDLLRRAAAVGLTTVDGLAMLIGQAAPSFEAMFGLRPPCVDVRTLALAALERAS